MGSIEQVVVAYSGGLDTSVILRWIEETYGARIITFTADVGQGEEVEEARQKALATGASKAYAVDLRREFVEDFVFPALRAGAVYENDYLLGTALSRPLIAREMIRIAEEEGSDTVCHGATGKGNDQVRFELTFFALRPDIQVIAPWREWDFRGRSDLIEYACSKGIEVPVSQAKPYSIDANLFHISYEGGALEDPWHEAPRDMWKLTCDPLDAPDQPEEIDIRFQEGNPVAVNGVSLDSVALLSELNRLAGRHGVGRIDIVENRFVGMKSRGCYETPGGTLLHLARRAVESITLDREVMHLRDQLVPQYAEMVYNGFWFAPEREALQKFMDEVAYRVSGTAQLRLFKGAAIVTRRKSDDSLYDPETVTFEEDEVYNQADAAGFIRLQALRLRTHAEKRLGPGE